MAKTVDIGHLTRAEWLLERRRGIGGSDVAGICGISKWQSPRMIWESKQDDYDPELIYLCQNADCPSNQFEPLSDEDVNPYAPTILPATTPKEEVKCQHCGSLNLEVGFKAQNLEHGSGLEDYIIKKFMLRTRKKIRKTSKMYIHEDYPWMIADVDGLVCNEDAILECKTVNAYDIDQWKQGVPDYYYAQILHYMAVLGCSRAYVAAFIGGQNLKWYTVDRNEEDIAWLIDVEKRFWAMVEGNTPPELVALDDEQIKQRYPYSLSGKSTVINQEAVDNWLKWKTLEKEAVDNRKAYENQIKNAIGDNEIGIADTHYATWKTDKKGFRTFTVKEKKNG